MVSSNNTFSDKYFFYTVGMRLLYTKPKFGVPTNKNDLTFLTNNRHQKTLSEL